MRKREKLEIMIDLYIDKSEESKRIEKLFRESSIPHVIHRKPSEYDKKLKRPYMTVGDPKGDYLGPSSNTRWMESVAKALGSSPWKFVDPRVSG